MSKYLGQSIRRVEDPRFIQGKGRYVANLKLPGMVHVGIKRSPYAHAIIQHVDTSAALAWRVPSLFEPARPSMRALVCVVWF
jgi:carbon-monoxide dehydrogenase large subunit